MAQVRKTMDNIDENICKCKRVLIAGQNTCDGGDILNECITWCKNLNIRCVTMGTDPILDREQAENLKYIKKGIVERNKDSIGKTE